MTYTLKPTSKFKKDVRKLQKRGCDLGLLSNVIDTIARGDELAARYKNHSLVGNYVGYQECHILPDWLLIYRIEDDNLILVLSRTGTHSDLF